MMGFCKTTVNGKVTWESSEGERLREPNERPKDMYGWKKVTVNGKVMWESPDGSERVMSLS